MSELDKAISELDYAKPNSKATGLSPEAEYWRQKYMNVLLAGQSIRTKTHDQERSTMAEKNAALQKENDAYEALFRVLAETLREYDPKVKSCHPAGLS